MRRSIEVELRYELKDYNDEINFDLLSDERIIDKYYDTKNGKFFVNGIFMRDRNGKKLDFKFNLEDLEDQDFNNDHTHCDEYTFPIPLKKSYLKDFLSLQKLLKFKNPKKFDFPNFLKVNDFIPLVVVDKERRQGVIDEYKICLDKVNNLGTFLEVEKSFEVEVGEDDYLDKLEELKKDIIDFVEDYRLKTFRVETGYCELILRQTNFNLYKKGKYLLDKDK